MEGDTAAALTVWGAHAGAKLGLGQGAGFAYLLLTGVVILGGTYPSSFVRVTYLLFAVFVASWVVGLASGLLPDWHHYAYVGHAWRLLAALTVVTLVSIGVRFAGHWAWQIAGSLILIAWAGAYSFVA